MNAVDADLPIFQPLDAYLRPSMPTEEIYRRLVRRARLALERTKKTPSEEVGVLQRATLRMLDDVVAPPACGNLLRELEESVADWIADPAPPSRLWVAVLPPCDANTVMEAWAREHRHQIMRPPERAALLSGEKQTFPELQGNGVVVIPRLENWFLRHRNGLTTVRMLLAALGRTRRHCVIGCNSWAWAFLGKSASADTMLPVGRTFQPFDAVRLGRWFSELATSEHTKTVTFRLVDGGEDVLALDDKGIPESDHMKKLAARSLGIPWVAWHLWRTGLRSELPKEADEHDERRQASGDADTLWVTELEEFVVPVDHKQDVLLVLQALLIHGSLSGPELGLVLPAGSWQTVLPIMLRARLVRKDGEMLSCAPAAYPAMRDELSAAGFSMPVF